MVVPSFVPLSPLRRSSNFRGGSLKPAVWLGFQHDRGGFRTHDLRIKSPLLCQLSYPVGWRKHRQGPTATQAGSSVSPQPRETHRENSSFS